MKKGLLKKGSVFICGLFLFLFLFGQFQNRKVSFTVSSRNVYIIVIIHDGNNKECGLILP